MFDFLLIFTMLINGGNGDIRSKEFAIFLHGMRVKKSRWYQSYFFIKMLEIGSMQPVLDACRTAVNLQRKKLKSQTIGNRYDKHITSV